MTNNELANAIVADQSAMRAANLLMEHLPQIIAALRSVPPEAALIKDAERYRWLRENSCNIYGDTMGVPIPQNDGSYRDMNAPVIRMMETLDAEIDKRIAAELLPQ